MAAYYFITNASAVVALSLVDLQPLSNVRSGPASVLVLPYIYFSFSFFSKPKSIRTKGESVRMRRKQNWRKETDGEEVTNATVVPKCAQMQMSKV